MIFLKIITFEEYANIVAEASYLEYPDLPTTHGFCMFIKREDFKFSWIF